MKKKMLMLLRAELDLVTLTTEGLMKPRFKSYNLSSRQSRQDGLSQTGASQPTEHPR